MRGILVTSRPIPGLDTASNRANDSAVWPHPCHWRVHCTTPFSHALISSRCLRVFYYLFIRALWPHISNCHVPAPRSAYTLKPKVGTAATAIPRRICATAVLSHSYFSVPPCKDC